MISIYIFLKHAKNVVSSVPWNSLHSSGLYFHEIQPNFSKSKIYSLFTQKGNYILSWGKILSVIYLNPKMKEVHNFVFAKKIGTIICFVLICLEIFSKNLPRDVIISHNNPKKTTFFQLFSSRTRQIYLPRYFTESRLCRLGIFCFTHTYIYVVGSKYYRYT